MTNKPAESAVDKAREEYKHALRSTYVSRDADERGRTYGLVDEDKADALIAALALKLADIDGHTNPMCGCAVDGGYGCIRWESL